MLCDNCKNKNKPIILNIETSCFKCGKNIPIKHAWRNICIDCSDTYLICQCCSKEIK